MRVILDAMGGDHAPQEIVRGAVLAKQAMPEVDLTLVGRKEAIEACLSEAEQKLFDIVDARDVITMEDDPSTATRRKKDASMTVALQMLKDGKGDAMVSAGSTGALLTGATLIVKRIKGIRRAAMAPVLPISKYGTVLVDCGANAECTPEYLLQFAFLGSLYSKKILGCAQPRVGLLNMGTEDGKGDELRHRTFELLKKADAEGKIHFVGNVEGSTPFEGNVEVLVADGFTGNVFLKCLEGTAKMVFTEMKGVFYQSLLNKICAKILYKGLKALKYKMSADSIGGTAFVGINKPVIKAHGSSKATAIVTAVKQAVAYSESGFTQEIIANLDYMKVDAGEAE